VDLHSLTVNTYVLAVLAKEWRISRLSVFGSIVRDDFHNDGDVDLLVEFDANIHYSLLDDLYRRKHILDTAQLLYAA
jgi:predicted nucleotidyltransferase